MSHCAAKLHLQAWATSVHPENKSVAHSLQSFLRRSGMLSSRPPTLITTGNLVCPESFKVKAACSQSPPGFFVHNQISHLASLMRSGPLRGCSERPVLEQEQQARCGESLNYYPKGSCHHLPLFYFFSPPLSPCPLFHLPLFPSSWFSLFHLLLIISLLKGIYVHGPLQGSVCHWLWRLLISLCGLDCFLLPRVRGFSSCFLLPGPEPSWQTVAFSHNLLRSLLPAPCGFPDWIRPSVVFGLG